jgi:hypothetical protein
MIPSERGCWTDSVAFGQLHGVLDWWNSHETQNYRHHQAIARSRRKTGHAITVTVSRRGILHSKASAESE